MGSNFQAGAFLSNAIISRRDMTDRQTLAIVASNLYLDDNRHSDESNSKEAIRKAVKLIEAVKEEYEKLRPYQIRIS